MISKINPILVHAFQMCSLDDYNSNLEQILDLSLQIKTEKNIQLICLPENALYMRVIEGASIPGVVIDHALFKTLQTRAKELNAFFHIGSAPLIKNNKLTNASLLIPPQGQIEVSYEKIHLFDIHLANGLKIKESDVFDPGHSPQIFDCGGWKFGQSICYDIRFSELYNYYARREVDAILTPSSFLVPTGEAHWHVLLRARAIESQSYIIAAAQAGRHEAHGYSRDTYGHSLIVDPWGKILQEASPNQVEIISHLLDAEQVQLVRKQIPMKFHRRSHL